MRNVVFAIASIAALELIFWAYTGFLKFIVQIIVINLAPIWTIMIFFLLGGLIFGFIRTIGLGLSMLYVYVCKIGTNEKFILVWTDIMVIAAVAVHCFRLWLTSEFLLAGFMGIAGLVIVTVNTVFLGIILLTTVNAAIRGEDINSA